MCCTFFSFLNATNVALSALSNRFGLFDDHLIVHLRSSDCSHIKYETIKLYKTIGPKQMRNNFSPIQTQRLSLNIRLILVDIFWSTPLAVLPQPPPSHPHPHPHPHPPNHPHPRPNHTPAPTLDWHLSITLSKHWVYRIFPQYDAFWNAGSSASLLHDQSKDLSWFCNTICGG